MNLQGGMSKAITVAVLHILIVSSLGAKLLYDRHTRPQAWFRTERYDPDLPIRGRYLSLQIDVSDPRSPDEIQQKFGDEIRMYDNARSPYMHFYEFGRECGSIAVNNGQPIAVFDGGNGWNCANLTFVRWHHGDHTNLRVEEPALFFISDTAKDPSSRNRGDELWVLATVPRKGLPRPIMLGLKKAGETEIRPIPLN